MILLSFVLFSLGFLGASGLFGCSSINEDRQINALRGRETIGEKPADDAIVPSLI